MLRYDVPPILSYAHYMPSPHNAMSWLAPPRHLPCLQMKAGIAAVLASSSKSPAPRPAPQALGDSTCQVSRTLEFGASAAHMPESEVGHKRAREAASPTGTVDTASIASSARLGTVPAREFLQLQHKAELAELNAGRTIDRLRLQLADAEDDRDTAKAGARAAQAAADKAKTTIRALKAEHMEARHSMERQIMELRAALRSGGTPARAPLPPTPAAHDSSQAVEAALAQQRAEFDTRVSSLQAALRAAEQAAAHTQEAAAQVPQLQAQVRALQAELTEAQSVTLEERERELQATKRELAGAQQALSVMKQDRDRAAAAAKDAMAAREDLHASRAALARAEARTREASAIVAAVRVNLPALLSAVHALPSSQQQLPALSWRDDAPESLEDVLHEAAQAVHAAAHSASGPDASSAAELADLRAQLETLQTQLTVTHASRDAAVAEASTAAAALAAAKSEATSARAQVDSMRGEIATLESMLAGMRARAAEPAAPSPQSGEELAAATARADAAEQRIEKLRSMLQKARAAANDMRGENAGLIARLAKGEFDPAVSRVLHATENPTTAALQARIKALAAELGAVRATSAAAQQPAASAASQGDLSTKMARMKQLFQQNIELLKSAVYQCTGWTVSLQAVPGTIPQVCFKSMFAEQEDDAVLVQMNNGRPELLSTPFVAERADPAAIASLRANGNLPAFFTAVQWSLLEASTMLPTS